MAFNEQELNRFKRGETPIFEKIIEEHKDKIFGNVIRLVRNEADAEEITQIVFVKCYTERKKFRGDSKLSVWLYRIAFNEALLFLRQNKKWLRLEEQARKSVPCNPKVEQLYDEKNKKEWLNKALDQLQPDEKRVIGLFYYEELSYQEIKERTGLTLSNVKIKIHRGKKKLKEQLIPYQNFFYER
jgi:RNA polymerase sigma-70 factor (ECF subfamily)